MNLPSQPGADIGLETRRVIGRRLLPVLFAAQFILYVDRINLGYAALAMNESLSIGPQGFGLAAGIFFFGYTLVEIPANLLAYRLGTSLWISRVMITWGCVAAGTAFVRGELSLVLMRFLLGVAEGGCIPAMLLIISRFYAPEQRGAVIGWVIMGSVMAGIVAGPLSTALLQLNGLGLQGWQWLFIIEGLPAVLLGLLVLRAGVLPESPGQARWLPPEHKEWLAGRMKLESLRRAAQPQHLSFVASLQSRSLWIFAGSYFCLSVGYYSLFFWLPQILQLAFPHLSTLRLGILSSVPYVLGLIVILIVSHTVDRAGSRRLHLAVIGIIAGSCLVGATQNVSPIVGFVLTAIAIGVLFGYYPAFWPAPMSLLGGTGAAGGFALINSIGNVGGFLGPYVVGLAKRQSGSFESGILFFAAFLFLAGLLPLCDAERFADARDRNQDRGLDRAHTARRFSRGLRAPRSGPHA